MSPASTIADRRWRIAQCERVPTLGNGGSINITLVVFHHGTETYWRTYYGVLDDWRAATWEQVEPVTETIIVYRSKGP